MESIMASAALSVGSSSQSVGLGLSISTSLPRITSTNSSDRVLPNVSRRPFRWLSKSDVSAVHWSLWGEGFRTRGGAFRSFSAPPDATANHLHEFLRTGAQELHL